MKFDETFEIIFNIGILWNSLSIVHNPDVAHMTIFWFYTISERQLGLKTQMLIILFEFLKTLSPEGKCASSPKKVHLSVYPI